MGLVGQELFQLVETPTPEVIVLLSRSGKIAFFKAHASQVFQYEKRIRTIFLHECLRDLMVHIRHPTVLSSRDGLESTLCRLGSLGLELSADFLEFMALGGNLLARYKFSLTLLVIADCKEAETTVNADNMADVLFLEICNSPGDRDMEIPQPFQLYQFSSAKFVRTIKVFGKVFIFKSTFSSLAKSINGQNLTIINKAVIPVADQVGLWTAKGHRLPEPFQSLADAMPVSTFILVSVRILR